MILSGLLDRFINPVSLLIIGLGIFMAVGIKYYRNE
tara:strand:+ start:140 stop:247 length:108 start_codon:yes stop_codon:yes gene_type:complete